MVDIVKKDLLYLFGLMMLTSWFALYLLLRRVNTLSIDEARIAGFWQSSQLLPLFLLFTATFADNYTDVFIRSKGARTKIYGLGSFVIGFVVLGTLYNDFVRSISSGDELLMVNFAVMLLVTCFSVGFSIIHSRKLRHNDE